LQFLYDSNQTYRNNISNYWNSGADTRMDFNIGRTANVAPVTVMSVGYNGNVGIGTTSPSAVLEVYAGASSTANTILWGETIRNAANASTVGYGVGLKLKISSDSGNEANKWAGIAAVAGTSYANTTDLAFYTNAVAGNIPTEKLRISSGGDATFSGNVTTTTLYANGSAVFNGVNRGAAYQYADMTNTGGRMVIGVESSVANVAFGGSTAYSTNFGSANATDVCLITNNQNRLTISSNGEVCIGANNPTSKLDVRGPILTNVNSLSSPIINTAIGDGGSQGLARNIKLLNHYPAVTNGNQLIIPFTSQGNLNSNTILKIWGHGARYNVAQPLGFEATIAVGHLTNLSSAPVLSSGGNISSVTTSGSNLLINFTTAYTYGTQSGIFVTLEYMTNNPNYSIIVGSITMN
jgi:hypothetical protein